MTIKRKLQVAGSATAAGLVLASCASVFISDNQFPCYWLEVSSAEGDTAVGGRRVVPWPRSECGSVSTFRISRANYSLEFWNGNDRTAELYARAVSDTGDELVLEGPGVHEIYGDVRHRASGFRYRVETIPTAPLPAGSTLFPLGLNFRVTSPTGTELGVEAVKIVQKIGRFWTRDGV